MITKKMILDYKAAVLAEKAAKDKTAVLKSAIMAEVEKTGETSKEWKDCAFLVSECNRTVLDSKALKKVHPDIMEAFSTVTTFTRLTVR